MKKIDDDVVWIISTVSACSVMAYITIANYCFFGPAVTGATSLTFAAFWALVHWGARLEGKKLEADES